MKILMFGEFSGFFNCLQDGFKALGHDTFLASNGDWVKNYPSDFRWDSHLHLGKLQGIYNVINIILHWRLFRGYDVVLFISPSLFGKSTWLNKIIYYPIARNNKMSYVICSGLYNYSFNFWYNNKQSKYYGYTSSYIKECKSKRQILNYINPSMAEYEEKFMKTLTGIIPIWYEYAEPYRHFSNLKKTIRTPVTLDKFEYKPNIVRNGKVVFFHGLSRPCKGGEFILAAFDRLREKHKNDAEFIAAGGLPFDKYMEIIDRTNVVVDDANSYSFCMNAFFSMLKGKVVMGGAEPEGNKELGYENVPVINIIADVDQICNAIEDLIERKNEIEKLGLESRKFVEKYHDHREIAKLYIQQFEDDLSMIDCHKNNKEYRI